jgi:hypothetical protein
MSICYLGVICFVIPAENSKSISGADVTVDDPIVFPKFYEEDIALFSQVITGVYVMMYPSSSGG